MFSRLLTITALLSGLVPALLAQNSQAGLNFIIGQPRGEFQDNVDNLGFGLGGMFAHRPGNSPFMIGAELEFLLYGHESRNVPLSTTIPDIRVDVRTFNSILLFQPLLRIQGNSGSLRPYADGFVGLHYLFTETSVADEDNIGGDSFASSFNQQDVALSYGVGGGLMVRLSQKEKPRGRRQEIFLDFRMRYSFGGEATYLKKGSITRENGTVSIDPLTSQTDLLSYQVGFVFAF